MADGSIATEPVLQNALADAKEEGRRLHFMGLVSRGGVHSQQDHLHALLRIAADAGVPDVVVHAFTDGRDTAPKLGAGYLDELEAVCEETGAGLATVCGRYWAMDRDKRWNAWRRPVLVNGKGDAFPNAQAAMAAAYALRSPTSSSSRLCWLAWTVGFALGMWSSASISGRIGAGKSPPPSPSRTFQTTAWRRWTCTT